MEIEKEKKGKSKVQNRSPLSSDSRSCCDTDSFISDFPFSDRSSSGSRSLDREDDRLSQLRVNFCRFSMRVDPSTRAIHRGLPSSSDSSVFAM